MEDPLLVSAITGGVEREDECVKGEFGSIENVGRASRPSTNCRSSRCGRNLTSPPAPPSPTNLQKRPGRAKMAKGRWVYAAVAVCAVFALAAVAMSARSAQVRGTSPLSLVCNCTEWTGTTSVAGVDIMPRGKAPACVRCRPGESACGLLIPRRLPKLQLCARTRTHARTTPSSTSLQPSWRPRCVPS